MRPPSDLQNTVSTSFENNHSSTHRDLFMQGMPVQDTSKEYMYLKTSKRQTFFMIFAFLLVVVLVSAIPIYVLLPFFSLQKPSTQALHSVPTHVPQVPRSMPPPSSIPAPLGRKILPTTGRIMTGVSMPGDLQTIETFEKDAKKNASIILSYQDWGETDGTQNFPTDWLNTVRQHGSLAMVTWEPWVVKVYPEGNNEPTYALKNIVAGNFDNYIKQWAIDAKVWGHPFFLRFAPEMNGDWTPWSEGINGNTKGEYIQAWRHIHDIFKTIGATNVTWVWCPNIEDISGPSILDFYPGDAYVDWTAMDGFNWGVTTNHPKWLSFSTVFSQTYQHILQITTKPMMVAETGCVEQGGDKAAWITDAYSVQVPQAFPHIKAIVWFNQVTQQDWRITTSVASLDAFTQALASPLYTANTYSSYTGG